MLRHSCLAIALLLSSIVASADTEASKMSYDQAVAALQTLLNSTTEEMDTHTPAKISVLVVADESGNLTITQTAQREQSDLFFRATATQSWKLRAADIDPKRIAMRTEPLSVYAPVKKDARRIQVTRAETKSRLEGGHEPAEDWNQKDNFVTSFIAIPVNSIDTAEHAAALMKQIVKTAPKTN